MASTAAANPSESKTITQKIHGGCDMADEKDRLGDKLHQAERASEDQWARRQDAEIIERLRRKYLKKPIPCPQCGKNLGAMVAIGLGGMACPDHHGAWGDQETLKQIATRLKNAVALRRDAQEEGVSIPLGKLAAELGRKHPAEIDCPDCGSSLEAEAAISPGAVGLTGMACPKRHGAWIDEDMLAEIRKRLDAATGTRHE